MSKAHGDYHSMYKNYTVATCVCGKPDKVQRFGECILCLDKRCLSGWVMVIGKKMASTFIGLRKVSSVGPAYWYEFLDHFIAYCWGRVASGGANGISVYDIDNALRSWRVRHKDTWVEEPSLEVTQPPEYDDEQPDDSKGNNLTEIASHLATSENSPEQAAFLSRLARDIQDPLLALYWAGELNIREVSLLAATTPAAWSAYSNMALEEVRHGRQKANKQIKAA